MPRTEGIQKSPSPSEVTLCGLCLPSLSYPTLRPRKTGGCIFLNPEDAHEFSLDLSDTSSLTGVLHLLTVREFRSDLCACASSELICVHASHLSWPVCLHDSWAYLCACVIGWADLCACVTAELTCAHASFSVLLLLALQKHLSNAMWIRTVTHIGHSYIAINNFWVIIC